MNPPNEFGNPNHCDECQKAFGELDSWYGTLEGVYWCSMCWPKMIDVWPPPLPDGSRKEIQSLDRAPFCDCGREMKFVGGDDNRFDGWECRHGK